MNATDRREDLLDAALALVASGDVDGVSVDSVADRAGVSRALVYKHFANRTEILTALYDREATRLHNELSADVLAARTLTDKYRALCHGSLAAASARGQIFDGLRSAAGRNKELRRVQRDRDRATSAAYVRLAVRELGVTHAAAEPVTMLLLGSIAPMLSAWHAKPSADYADQLEQAYMCLVVGALAELRRTAKSARPEPAEAYDSADEAVSSWLLRRVEKASADELREMLTTVVTAMSGPSPAG